MEIATVMTTISSLGRPPALSKRNPSFSTKAIASVAQSEASSITAHGGGATLQDCMGLWDAATHMSKQEWKAACMRSMVVEFPYGSRQPSPAVEPRSHQLGAVFGRRILLTRSHEADRVPRGSIDHSNSAVMNTTNPGDQPTGDEEYVGGTAGSAPNCVHHPLFVALSLFFSGLLPWRGGNARR